MTTYFTTASTHAKKPLFQNEHFAALFVERVLDHRDRNRFDVHAFVVMPDHFHLLISVGEETLERAMQFVKGGFSFHLKQNFGFCGEVWQAGYHDRRVRDISECLAIIEYIHLNPVRARLCSVAQQYPFSSACGHFALDPLPQRL